MADMLPLATTTQNLETFFVRNRILPSFEYRLLAQVLWRASVRQSSSSSLVRTKEMVEHHKNMACEAYFEGECGGCSPIVHGFFLGNAAFVRNEPSHPVTLFVTMPSIGSKT